MRDYTVRIKRIISILLAIIITVGIIEPLPNNKVHAATQFTDDVPSWAEESVNDLVKKGIVDGYPDGTFRPNNPITIEEFVKITLGALGHTNLPSNGGHWADPYMNKAKDLGLFRDEEASEKDNQFFDHFNVNRTRYITRQEVCFIINQAEKIIKHGNVDYEESETFIKSLIGDFDDIDDVYKKYVIDAYGLGLTDGVGHNKFDPKGLVTRAQAAVFIYRLLHDDKRVRVGLGDVFLSINDNITFPFSYHSGNVDSQIQLSGYAKNAHHMSLKIDKPDGTTEYMTRDGSFHIYSYTPTKQGNYTFTLLARNTKSNDTPGTELEAVTAYLNVNPSLAWLNWKPTEGESMELYQVFEYMYLLRKLVVYHEFNSYKEELLGFQTALLFNNIILHDKETYQYLYN